MQTEFYLCSVDQVSGRAVWNNSHAYRRCRWVPRS